MITKDLTSKPSSRVASKERGPFIGTIQEAPAYLVDNENVRSGYRINFTSNSLIFKSLFMIHNESVNIWSHLLGAIFFVGMILYTSHFMAPPGLYNQ